MLTGVLEANRSVLGAASAGELAVQQLLQASGIEAATGAFARTDIGGDLRGNRATVNRAVGGRFDGQRFEGDDFHISGSSANDIFHRINDLDGKLYNCKYVTEYCFPKAPVIAETTCSDCRRTDSAEYFSGQANALVKRCQHGCDYQWQLGDVSGSCSSGSIGEGGHRKVSCPVSASLDAGERRRTFIDLVAVNANDTTKRTSHRFAVDWEREDIRDPFDNFIVNWECQSVDQGRTGNFTGSGRTSCSSLGGPATIIWDYSYPNAKDEYYISKETPTGDGYCGSYNVDSAGGIVGSSFQGSRRCAFGVEITITHISGESITLDMRTASHPNL